MSVDNSKDIYMILFPPTVTLGLLLFWFPASSTIIWLMGFDKLALLYYIASTAGYLIYEVVHFSSHHTNETIYYKIPILAQLWYGR